MAWAITDVEDVQTYHEFFTAVKNRVPDANVTVLMTDDGKGGCVPKISLPFQILQFLQHALQYSYPGVNYLLCRWHIDQYNYLLLQY